MTDQVAATSAAETRLSFSELELAQLRRACDESHYGEDFRLLEEGGRPTLCTIRDDPDGFLSFKSGEVSRDSNGFLYYASNLGVSSR